MDFKEINQIIQGTSNLLEQEFYANNIEKARQKDKYNCIGCQSSDGLHLYSDTNTCHCFSCGQTWSVTNFVMQVQNITYIEAIKYLNDTYSLGLPLRRTKKDNSNNPNEQLQKKFEIYKHRKIKKLEDDYNYFHDLSKRMLEHCEQTLTGNELEEKKKEIFEVLSADYFKLNKDIDYINNLTLDMVDINEVLEIKILHPKQEAFNESKLKLLGYADIKNKEGYDYIKNKEALASYFKNLTRNEWINYAKYEANATVEINRYIDECNKLHELLNYNHSLLIAPTGSGKTYTILKMFVSMKELLDKQKTKVCFVVPNATQVQQIQEEYGVLGAWDNADQDAIFNLNAVSCYTWDKFGKIKEDLSNTIVILDEIHQTLTDMYRKHKIDKMIENLNKCKKRIDITATPNKLDFKKYEYILEYKQKTQTNYNVKLYNKIDRQRAIDIINSSNGKVALFEDNISSLETFKKNTSKKADIINSANKDTNITYKSIVKDSVLGDINLLLNTSVIVAGVNIKEPAITDIILIGVKDITHIKQYVARFRDLESVNVHIFNDYKDISKVYSIEKVIEYNHNNILDNCIKYNMNRVKGFEGILFEEFDLFKDLNKDLLVKMQDGIYIPDVVSIRNKAYTNYYNNADIVSFKNLLEEYFCNIEIMNTVKVIEKELEFKKSSKEANKQAKEYIDKLAIHTPYLVGYYEAKKGKRITGALKDYYFKHNLDTDKILDYTRKRKLDYMLDNVKVKKKLNGFTKLVVEKGYSTNLAYKMSNMKGNNKALFYGRFNVLLFERLYNKHKDFINLDMLEVKLYFFISNNFFPTIGYDDNDIVEKLELLKNEYNIELTSQQLKNYINMVYIVDSKLVRVDKDQEGKGKTHIRAYCPIDYHTLDSLCQEYALNDLDKRCIDNIIENKFNNYVFSINKIKDKMDFVKVFD